MEKKFDIDTYVYHLPKELIAQEPLEKRDSSKLMLLDRSGGNLSFDRFYNLPDYLNPGDCLVINNTKVIPARLYGRTEKTNAAIEILLLDNITGQIWEVMMKNSRRVDIGTRVLFPEGIIFTVVKKKGKTVEGRFNYEEKTLLKKIWKSGVMPLPPYIKEGALNLKHRQRYQTVFAKYPGAKAAPTAGLHLTPSLLQALRKKGIKVAEITLHIGLGTFEPVNESDIRSHMMHAERYEITAHAAGIINNARKSGNKVVALGTTSLRALETACDENGMVRTGAGITSIYIYPGYRFKIIDALITNFHLPKSTLLFLVCAFAGTGNTMRAYKTAVENNFRFFSYGDAMMIR